MKIRNIRGLRITRRFGSFWLDIIHKATEEEVKMYDLFYKYRVFAISFKYGVLKFASDK